MNEEVVSCLEKLEKVISLIKKNEFKGFITISAVKNEIVDNMMINGKISDIGNALVGEIIDIIRLSNKIKEKLNNETH